jgi:hypothetical protein
LPGSDEKKFLQSVPYDSHVHTGAVPYFAQSSADVQPGSCFSSSLDHLSHCPKITPRGPR